MAILITENLDALSPDSLVEAEDFLVGLVSQLDPTIDMNPGSAVRQLVVRLYASLYELNRQNNQRVLNSNSIRKAVGNPDEVDSDTIQNLASNYFIEKNQGTRAAGQIRVVLKTNRYTVIAKSTVFTINGVQFRPIRSFSGVSTPSEVVTGNERLIQSVGGGQFAFVVDVEAVEAGTGGNILKGSAFGTNTPNNNVAAYLAESDFDGGADDESDADFILRLSQGLATSNLSSRSSIPGFLVREFPKVKDVSVIGAGDPEMRRDQRNILGVSAFGKVDIYVRTADQLINSAFETAATLVSNAGMPSAVWRVNIPRNLFPAMYEVSAVSNLQRTTSYDVVKLVRGVDSSRPPGVDFDPDTYSDAYVFSRYQTAYVDFVASGVGNLLGATRNVVLDVVHQPQIDQISDYVLSRANRPPAGDYLVRAAVPCIVAIGLEIVLGVGDPVPDIGQIKKIVADTVNQTDFQTGRLSVDVIIDAVRGQLSGRTRVRTPVDMRGRIPLPVPTAIDVAAGVNSTLWIFNSNSLDIPDVSELSISARTVAFFCKPGDVDVTITQPDQLIV